jgi:glycosyltransferase involved in cell wall biosynthesis
MKIGVEARWIMHEKTGFGNYALNLLKELATIDTNNKYLIYLNGEYSNAEIFNQQNFQQKVINRPPEIYKHISIPLDIISQKRKFDFFHFLYNAPSLFMPCPFVLTVHDLSFKHVPEMISKKNFISLNSQMHLTAKKATKIITVSENSKKDIIQFLKIPDKKIEVIYEAADSSFKVINDEDARNKVREKYNLPPQYLLYVGTYLPHKNLETLIRALHKLRQDTKVPYKLVFAGNMGRNFETINTLIVQLGLENDIHTIGFVPEQDLPVVYSLSDLFIFPSLYEGFGLPLIEAMACGVPVLSSNSSCLPEIGGESALYFSPKDVEDLADKITHITQNETLRNEMIGKGLKRAKTFNWHTMAEKTLRVYETVYKELHN